MPLVPLASSGGPRDVDPHVAAADEPRGDAEVVVLEEDDAPGDAVLPARAEDVLDDALGLVVLGVGLAGEHELDRPLAADEPEAALEVVAAAGTGACRWRRGGRSRSSARRGRRRWPPPPRSGAARRGRRGRARCGRGRSRRAGRAARAAPPTAPRRGSRRSGRRSRGRPGAAASRAEVAVEQLAHRRADPRRDVHAVGDVGDRHVLDARGRATGPATSRGDVAVAAADAVGRAARAQRELGDAERLAAVVGVRAAEPDDALVVEPGALGEPARASRRSARPGRCRCPPGPACAS